MAVILTEIEKAIMNCIGQGKIGGCRIFDPDGQPSVLSRLQEGWDPITWTIHSGNELMMPNMGPFPLHVQVVCCMEHEEALIARGGWDGTGERQSTK
jgi:hypothetical protein